MLLAVAALALTAGGCGGSDGGAAGEPIATAGEGVADSAAPATDAAAPDASPSEVTEPVPDQPADPPSGLAEGPVSLIALGDSLTAGEGDDTGLGYVGRLAESIGAVPGREDVSISNFGVSGWDSTMMVNGGDGAPGQLDAAVADVRTAVDAGRAVLATVLIGSNDMWYLYAYGPVEQSTTPADIEDAAEQTYRANLERTVTELQQAGAVVVLGLPDEQSIRPAVVDIDQLHNYLPDVTEEEIPQMVAMAGRLGTVVQEIADRHGLRTVDTNGSFWADSATMADDGIHPNGDGYALLADLWMAVIADML
jgi:lysophospholipase L1-like esterase